MNTTQEFSEQEFELELQELIKMQKGEGLSFQFTEKVMGQILVENEALEYKPVISKQAMVMISVFFGILLLLTSFQSGSATESLWRWPAFLTNSLAGLVDNWVFPFPYFSIQGLFSSGLFLAISGLILALGVHYVFMAVVSNQSNKKLKQLYAF